MWFIGVEVEQETSAPPPKKNPGSAPDRVHISSDNLSRNSYIITAENRTYIYEHTTKPQTYYGRHLRLTFHAPDSLPYNEITSEIFLTFKSFQVTVFNLLLEKYEKYE